MPTKAARATMLWPMLNSHRPSIDGDRPDIAIRQAVAGVDDEISLPCGVAACDQFLYASCGGGIAFGVGIGAGVKFDGVAAGIGGGINLVDIGRNKRADDNAFFVHLANEIF